LRGLKVVQLVKPNLAFFSFFIAGATEVTMEVNNTLYAMGTNTVRPSIGNKQAKDDLFVYLSSTF
jgi:hypothetical protein